MPNAVLSRFTADHVVRLAYLPELLIGLVRLPAGKPGSLPDGIKFEVQVARDGGGEGNAVNDIHQMDHIGRRSAFTCPDCGGLMWQIEEEDLAGYRCHVGHAYTAEVLALALDKTLGRALASAPRGLEERAALAQSFENQALKRGRKSLAEIWAARAQEHSNEANIIRSAMKRVGALAAEFVKANGGESGVDVQEQLGL
jgi:two-component system, chemotaxis family, protein-glutamate methylesterase/glutaminase